MALYRPVTAPQVIVAGLALFLTGASGPDVPGNPPADTQDQAIAAYRPSSYLVAQPARPSIVAMLPAAEVVLAVPAQVQPPQPAWPYALQQASAQNAGALAPNLGTQIPPSPVRQWLTQTSWPYTVSTPAEWTPILPPTALVLPTVVAQIQQQPWPYSAAVQLPSEVNPALVPSLGVQIAPSPVLQWLVQPPWPYVATLTPKATNYSPVAVYTWSPAVVPVRQPEWPYAAIRLGSPSASRWAQATAYTRSPQPVLVPVRVPEWSYVATVAQPRLILTEGGIDVLSPYPGESYFNAMARSDTLIPDAITDQVQTIATVQLWRSP